MPSELDGSRPKQLEERKPGPVTRPTARAEFEEHSAQASCAVVLLTADDTGGPRNGGHQPRACQNVVLELGFVLGRLVRDRVVILYEPGVELPSDLQGVLYIELDRAKAWRMSVARELGAASPDSTPSTTRSAPSSTWAGEGWLSDGLDVPNAAGERPHR